MEHGMSISKSEEKGSTEIETRYSITVAIPERLYEELMRSIPEERLAKVIMEGIGYAIRMEKGRNEVNIKL